MSAAAVLAAMAVVSHAQAPATPQFRYGAPVDVRSFLYQRDIGKSGPGVTELTLDAAALAHCSPGFADLRIVAADGRQVPYVIGKDATSVAMQLPALENDPSRPGTALRRTRPDGHRNNADDRGAISRYLVRLPYSHLPPARLVLHTTARVFEREVWLEVAPGSGAERPDADWRIVATSRWSHTDPESDAQPLTFEFGSLPTSTLHLAVDEGDNAQLPLGRPALLLPAYRVRFIRPAAPLRLVYGNRRLDAPRYDLALEAASLLDLPAERVAAGPEQQSQPAHLPAGILFWSALVLAVVVLFGLLGRLVRKDAAS